jgi:FK506-binding nuclear protein
MPDSGMTKPEDQLPSIAPTTDQSSTNKGFDLVMSKKNSIKYKKKNNIDNGKANKLDIAKTESVETKLSPTNEEPVREKMNTCIEKEKKTPKKLKILDDMPSAFSVASSQKAKSKSLKNKTNAEEESMKDKLRVQGKNTKINEDVDGPIIASENLSSSSSGDAQIDVKGSPERNDKVTKKNKKLKNQGEKVHSASNDNIGKETQKKIKEEGTEMIKSILKSKNAPQPDSDTKTSSNEDSVMPRPMIDTPRPQKDKKVFIEDRSGKKDNPKTDMESKGQETPKRENSTKAPAIMEPRTPKVDSLNMSLPAKTPSRRTKGGVIVKDIILGKGKTAKPGKTVGIYFQAKLKATNKVIESRKNKDGKPFSFKIGGGEVTKGLDVGVEGMLPGGKRKITVPPQMAKGHKIFSSDDVPSNSILVFEVECRYVDKPKSKA